MTEEEVNGMSWEECRMYILRELKRTSSLLSKIDDKIDSLNLRVASIAAAVGIITTFLTNLVMKHVK
jgi:hypothetical protein